MKIFLAFLQSEVQHPIPAYNFWQYYIKNGIEEAGHKWLEHPGADWAAGLIPKSQKEQTVWKADIWDKTINYLRANPADLFLSYLYPEQIDATAINEIKSMGIPCINFYCDNVRQFIEVPKEFAVFNLNWVPEYKALKLYQKAGYPYINAPMPIWVETDRRKIHAGANRQVTFIGSKDIQRALFFEKVIEQDPALNLCIYGNGWKDGESQPASFAKSGSLTKINNQYAFIKQHGIVPYLRKLSQRLGSNTGNNLRSRVHDLLDFETYNRLIAASMITVGINRYPSYRFPLTLPDTYSRLRDIEAPMLGACYLTEYTEGLEYLYNLGEEIETYSTPDDFIEKVHQLANDPQQRQRLKLNGQKRALGEHTIPNTLNKLIQKTSLRLPAINLYFRKPPLGYKMLPGDRYVLNLLRKIAGLQRVSGLERVFVNLCKGFDELKVDYKVNRPFHKIKAGEPVVVLGVGKYALKGYNQPNPVIAGIGLMTHPNEWPTLFSDYPVIKYLQHANWTNNIYARYFDPDNCTIWPAGIDTNYWQPAPDTPKKTAILIYNKIMWDKQATGQTLRKPVLQALSRLGLSYKEITYGNYHINEYKQLLQQSRAMIFLCEHESQGFACCEALAMNVPVFAWDQGCWFDPNRFKWNDPDVPATSIPFFDERCGMSFKDAGDFESKLETFWHKVQHNDFAPRDYILENLTLKKSAERMLEIIHEAYT